MCNIALNKINSTILSTSIVFIFSSFTYHSTISVALKTPTFGL